MELIQTVISVSKPFVRALAAMTLREGRWSVQLVDRSSWKPLCARNIGRLKRVDWRFLLEPCQCHTDFPFLSLRGCASADG
ncbi:hypothetical protein PIB30_044965 [Stylosanthes scabra]|uniref:Uncharacterized protein n=1 Tax=Stylosanthes scabra TaxID=79078 RepID=A0ABU6TFP9_9FABA|nr:hypothetical protein [Stylosanthes scabra]